MKRLILSSALGLVFFLGCSPVAAPDTDGDGIPDLEDICPTVADDQTDLDGDGQGDGCDEDIDGDGVINDDDYRPFDAEIQIPPGDEDAGPVVNDAGVPEDSGTMVIQDRDGDGVADDFDNCPDIANEVQEDDDADGIGNYCDTDWDNDGVDDLIDNCYGLANPDQADQNGDGFGDACQPPTCGDFFVTEFEQCDDGNTDNFDGCSRNCTLENGWTCGADGAGPCFPVCGDGILLFGLEECDDGNAPSAGCSASCNREPGYNCTTTSPSICNPRCGDGYIRGVEQCDDANLSSGDGCSTTCRLEFGWTCQGTSCAAICGDGFIVAGQEECDDGNAASNDGCSRSCSIEPGFACEAIGPDGCQAVCGDGQVVGDEQCDDGNTDSGDGCSEVCNLEEGFECGTNCVAICGDGKVRGAEECDDGDAEGADGCSANCKLEFGFVCNQSLADLPTSCEVVHGDGYVRGEEECDDGNAAAGDGCSATGTLERDSGFVCLIAGAPCTPIIGDGRLVGDEACDDSNQTDGDGCSGNGHVETGYTCDRSGCVPIFGDGLLAGDEACDDANATGYDGCTLGVVDEGYRCEESGPNSCLAICGDGLLRGGEQCDDGNSSPGDGCSSFCNVEFGYECQEQSELTNPQDAGTVADAQSAANLDGSVSLTDASGSAAEDAGIADAGPLQGDSFCFVVHGDRAIVGDEVCDDGNTRSGDGCAPNGQLEYPPGLGFRCPSLDGVGGPCLILFGDAIAVPGYEQCDDGNRDPRDGCSPLGKVELGFVCSGGDAVDGSRPSVCTADISAGYRCADGENAEGAACELEPIRGDGRVVGDEECDDGTGSSQAPTVALSGDGCSELGELEPGWDCSETLPTQCSVNVGDGYAVPGQEDCDDANAESGDGCSPPGNIDSGYQCAGALRPDGTIPSVCSVILGDGYVVPGIEECDDGTPEGATGPISWDGCSRLGKIEPGFVCTGGDAVDGTEPSQCTADIDSGYRCLEPQEGGNANTCTLTAIRGDGKMVGEEECDDGTGDSQSPSVSVSGDGCTADGKLEPGWDCTASSPTTCTLKRGDGFVVAGHEECDDGNTVAGDGCDAAGHTEDGFTCEGGTKPNGSSPSFCQVIRGDGYVVIGRESCDDGAAKRGSGDGCTDVGLIEPGWQCLFGVTPDGSNPSVCTVIRGDGFIVSGHEECDDKSLGTNDGCSDEGIVQPGFRCTGGSLVDGSDPSRCEHVNGDGFVVVGLESCDDRNVQDGDGCSALGVVEIGFTCSGGTRADGSEPSACAVIFGDAYVVTGYEACDDGTDPTEGGAVSGDGCSAAGLIEAGYVCTGGTAADGSDPSVCTVILGDGFAVRPVEECDDGNENNADGCGDDGRIERGYNCFGGKKADGSNPSVCDVVFGDGIVVAPHEECDDGPTLRSGGDGCTPDGQRELGWDCDSAEPTTCSEVHQDGRLVGAEACDDGNGIPNDGCSNLSTIDVGYRCAGEPSACSVVYGDGYVVGDEECDDGIGTTAQPSPAISGDGCSSTGLQEEGYTCVGGRNLNDAPSRCDANLGDGKIRGNEACDDGNIVSGDGCDDAGQIEAGFRCPNVGSGCLTVYGDGYANPGFEACDDGNTASGDGCGPQGQVESLYVCTLGLIAPGGAEAVQPSKCTSDTTLGYECASGNVDFGSLCQPKPIYGDGRIVAPEQCDDGINEPNDGCVDGRVQDGWRCLAADARCAPIVGDSRLVGAENCDDGGQLSGDGCSEQGQIETGWECAEIGKACVPDYGDGLLVGNEECDDSNETNLDGCSAQGQVEGGWLCPTLGAACELQRADGYVVVGRESCDDGNVVAGDGCSNNAIDNGYACTGGTRLDGQDPSICDAIRGDGYVVTGIELCDDGPTKRGSGDGCSPSGVIEAGWECNGGDNVGGNTPSICAVLYGDGYAVPGQEACDDGLDLSAGTPLSGDGCSANGKVETGYRCTGGDSADGQNPSSCTAIPLDGYVAGTEKCDDRNQIPLDGCDEFFQIESGWSCEGGDVLGGQASVCNVILGDGYVVAGRETCDDGVNGGTGAPASGDGCSADGSQEDGYACVGGSAVDGSDPSVCTVVFGDGFVVSGQEECDDKNAVTGDGCAPLGVVEDGYTCIGGDKADGTNRSDCSVLHGDGYVVAPVEACDDGPSARAPNDGCSPNGLVEPGWTCVGGSNASGASPSVCSVVFGDGYVVNGQESCDDGVDSGTGTPQSGDGCSENGVVEQGYRCVGGDDANGQNPSLCSAIPLDGYVTGNEECDDGNATAGDGCDAAFQIEAGWACIGGTTIGGDASLCTVVRGDGFVVANQEECDDGEEVSTGAPVSNDGCSAEGLVEDGYTCSGGDVSDGSNPSDCTVVIGDGYVVAGKEACDDGGQVAGDGCSVSGIVERGYACTGGNKADGSAPSICNVIFGDGIVVSGLEICDDGGLDADDGCSPLGQIETGWDCDGAEPTACVETRQDGLIVGSEQCDDNNGNADDGCSNLSQVNVGYRCTGEPSVCVVVLGDGIVVSGTEQCDDGTGTTLNPSQAVAGDGCSETGQTETGYTCVGGKNVDGAASRCTANRGDGLVRGDEQCDDGNTAQGDGCDENGNVEAGYICPTEGSACESAADPDGIIAGDEECDDNNNVRNDGCSNWTVDVRYVCNGAPSLCTADVSGGYQCDDGSVTFGAACAPRPIYGDARIVPPEACDDGNQNLDDGCSGGNIDDGWVCENVGSGCVPYIGDGLLVGGETCDDGGAIAGDGCNASGSIETGWECLVVGAACTPDFGDGLLVGAETCDDGNEDADDGCSAVGQIESGWNCPNVGAACELLRADGYIVAGYELCDDGNTIADDGCTGNAVDTGYACTGGTRADGRDPSACVVVKGDGYIVSGIEACDDGAAKRGGGDGCSPAGLIEDGWACSGGETYGGAPSVCSVIYGDGYVVSGQEACDDGTDALTGSPVSGDGCSDVGDVEDGYRCSGGGDPAGQTPSVCVAIGADGFVAGDEECDDQNDISGDGCSALQKIEDGWLCVGGTIFGDGGSVCSVVLGDGYVVTGQESCDDGKDNVTDAPKSGDGCSALGAVENGYSCVGGTAVDGSVPSVCSVQFGDGFVVSGVEQCDDGNRNEGDGCDLNGNIDNGYACAGGTKADGTNPSNCSVVKGDGYVVTPIEACDDGPLRRGNGDGCTSLGQVEAGWDCSLGGTVFGGAPSTCIAILGDGFVVAGQEACDDGSDSITGAPASGDGCSALGVVEAGYSCIGGDDASGTNPSTCSPIASDGFVTGDEECDDQNALAADGCSPNQKIESGWLCVGGTVFGGEPSACSVIFGDGFVVANQESCDDGKNPSTNSVESGDGCSEIGEIEDGYSCVGGSAADGSDPSVCNVIRGDGFVVVGVELCDDGNQVENDGCDALGQTERGYSCTGGTKVNGTSPSVCTVVFGDGLVVSPYEQCDDGPNARSAGDGCSPNGQKEVGWDCNADEPTLCVVVHKDGLLVGNEACDDGNDNAEDGCNNISQINLGYVCAGSPSVCEVVFGDGVVVAGVEECDDGLGTTASPSPAVSNDGCSSEGRVENGFTCVGGNNIDGSPTRCTANRGDGQLLGDEECDDGNLQNGDGCDQNGQIEAGYACPLVNQPCSVVLNDGYVVAGHEACDDKNPNASDGCNSGVVEARYVCSGGTQPDGSDPSRCTADVDGGYQCDDGSVSFGAVCAPRPVYGDGRIVAPEACDDGVNETNDGCVAGLVQVGWNCVVAGERCTPIIGDGLLRGTEQCDDGGALSNDGCSNAGVIEDGWECNALGASCTPDYGDGKLRGNETCDDGNEISLDGCTSLGQIEAGWSCAAPGSPCALLRSDGYVVLGQEVCDDGNNVAGDGCTNNQIDTGYACDGGTQVDGSDPSDCIVVLGDGYIVLGMEQCDDGPTRRGSGDGCTDSGVQEFGWSCEGGTVYGGEPTQCTVVYGDGFAVAGREACDDGVNASTGEPASGDGCSATGQVETGFSCINFALQNNTPRPSACTANAADGFVAGNEQCDDRNTNANDGCSPSMQLEAGWSCVGGNVFGSAPSTCNVIFGDGYAVPNQEECDDVRLADGNSVSLQGGDGCSVAGQVEQGYACTGGDLVDGSNPSVCTVLNADGFVVAGVEACDDANTESGDGCSNNQIDRGYVCAIGNDGNGVRRSLCEVVLGDGIVVTGAEFCDDGSGTTENPSTPLDGDGCSTLGTVELGWQCDASEPSVCSPIIGDLRIVRGEFCDDGDSPDSTDEDDGCSTTGNVQTGWTCEYACPDLAENEAWYCDTTGQACSEIPDDGLVVGRELCDDGDEAQDLGCTRDGQILFGYECDPTTGTGAANPSICTVNPTDRYIVVGIEECDDGNLVDGDGCTDNTSDLGYVCSGGDDPNDLNDFNQCQTQGDDGWVAGDEECDDGNVDAADGCYANLIEAGWLCDNGADGIQTSICTVDRDDGFIVLNQEQCDDANAIQDDGCSNNGEILRGYVCSGGDASDGTKPSVCSVVFGDGYSVTGIESCDDGVESNSGEPTGGDGCSVEGVVEFGWSCTLGCVAVDGVLLEGTVDPCAGFNAASQCVPTRRDGYMVGDESCDDGDGNDQNGCTALSTISVGYSCTASDVSVDGYDVQVSSCTPVLNDGFKTLSEQCDDGNTASGDGCANGLLEDGWICNGGTNPNGSSPSQCNEILNDGLVVGAEQCDDGNTIAADGCHNGVLANGYYCSSPQCIAVETQCGDRVVAGNEQCDNGGQAGCLSDCSAAETGYSCSPTGGLGSCSPICGDGFVVPGLETCDDGDAQGGDGCSDACQTENGWTCPSAGGECTPNYNDSILVGGEVCADTTGTGGCVNGALQYGFTCVNAASCTEVTTTCGDGQKAGSEKCDDGNTRNGDGCAADCLNTEQGWSCSSAISQTPDTSCNTVCGDALVRGAEACDDGNASNGDGCSASCSVEAGFNCSGQGAGSCSPEIKLFLTSRRFSTGDGFNYASINADCQARGAHFCTEQEVYSYAQSGQVDSSAFGVKAWRPNPQAGSTGSCFNLGYGSGHVHSGATLRVNSNGTVTLATNNSCGPANFHGHCCKN